MAADKIEEKSTLTYDDRRKILVQKKSQITENKTDEVIGDKEKGIKAEESKLVSTVNQSMQVEYTEEGIRLAHKNLKDEKGFHETQITKIKTQLIEAGELTPELAKLKEDLQTIGKIDAAEKQKVELKAQEDRLKIVNDELKSIEDEIGTRLKL
ncbi:MAG: hypothetical protein ACTSWD_04885 [Candidatus Heimdallarchaeota archaeon]